MTLNFVHLIFHRTSSSFNTSVSAVVWQIWHQLIFLAVSILMATKQGKMISASKYYTVWIFWKSIHIKVNLNNLRCDHTSCLCTNLGNRPLLRWSLWYKKYRRWIGAYSCKDNGTVLIVYTDNWKIVFVFHKLCFYWDFKWVFQIQLHGLLLAR